MSCAPPSLQAVGHTTFISSSEAFVQVVSSAWNVFSLVGSFSLFVLSLNVTSPQDFLYLSSMHSSAHTLPTLPHSSIFFVSFINITTISNNLFVSFLHFLPLQGPRFPSLDTVRIWSVINPCVGYPDHCWMVSSIPDLYSQDVNWCVSHTHSCNNNKRLQKLPNTPQLRTTTINHRPHCLSHA